MLKAIAAMTRHNVIGRANQIPWHYSEDLQRFKRLTLRQPVIMGRLTWESLPFRPLPARQNIVLSQDEEQRRLINEAGGLARATKEEVLELIQGFDAWVIGGQKIYELFWPEISEVYLTIVPDRVADGDTYFPHMASNVWEQTAEERSGRLIYRKMRRKA